MKLINQSTLTSKITLPGGGTEDIETKSNESSTEQMTKSFSKIKAANKTYVKADDEVEYTITLTNDSEYEITNMSFKDTISADAHFIAGSVTIDDTPYADYNPFTGFDLANLAASNSTVIKYSVKANNIVTGSTLDNVATVTYSVNEVSGLTENTNQVSLPIVNNKITLTKTSDKSVVISGQTLTYQIVVANAGNTKNTDLVFTDPLPTGVTFVADSVKFDDVVQAGLDPTAGFSMPDLDVGDSVTVKFDVTVD